ncbi:MAG TPA: large conductance mechanosensitive channel protein MscL [Nitriliruptorales bacterium]
MLQEFKDFINKGNVIDLAVAFVMGLAFAPVIGAITDRVLMPLIGLIFGEPNFDAIGTFADGEGSIGAVLTAAVNFVLVAFALFLVVKAHNATKKRAEEEQAGPSEIDLLTEIRDSLAKR